ncbi:MAG: hypothetical protein Q8O54_12980 [Brevundimonas sp.]|nr:hypothetical protein [Brevundimonas sp.]
MALITRDGAPGAPGLKIGGVCGAVEHASNPANRIPATKASASRSGRGRRLVNGRHQSDLHSFVPATPEPGPETMTQPDEAHNLPPRDKEFML